MVKRSIPLLVLAVLATHCDKSGATNHPESPEPVKAGLGPHPEVDGELPALVPLLEGDPNNPRSRRGKVLWLASERDWAHQRHELTGAIIARMFVAEAIVKYPDEDECYAIDFYVVQELLEDQQYGPSRQGTTFSNRKITCGTAELASFGYRPGGAAGSGDVAASEAAPAGDAAPPAASATPTAGSSSPPSTSGATSDAYRQAYAQMFTMLDPVLKEQLKKSDTEESDYSAGAKTKKPSDDVVKLHDEVVSQKKKIEADYKAWTADYESHKGNPSQDDVSRLSRDGQTLMQSVGKVMAGYAQLKTKM